jgi:hypothetical protein
MYQTSIVGKKQMDLLGIIVPWHGHLFSNVYWYENLRVGH